MIARLLIPAATLALGALMLYDAATAYQDWLTYKLEGFLGGLVVVVGLLLIPIAYNGGK